MPYAGQIIRASLVPRTVLSDATQQTLSNSTTETVIGTLNIPASDAVVGAIYRLMLFGVASVTSTPTFTLKCRLGGLAGTTAGTLGAVTASSSVSNKAWSCHFDLVCITAGPSATWAARCHLEQAVSSSSTTGAIVDSYPSTTITADSTLSQDMVITWAWGTASSSNTMLRQGVIAQRLA